MDRCVLADGIGAMCGALSRQLRLLADRHMCGTVCLRAPENALTRGLHIFTLVREADEKRTCTISLPAFVNYPYVADVPYSRKSQVAEDIRTKAYIEDHLEVPSASPTGWAPASPATCARRTSSPGYSPPGRGAGGASMTRSSGSVG